MDAQSRIEILEAALAEYVARYGFTEKARAAMIRGGSSPANLDAEYASQLGELFRSFNQVGVTVLIATHDQQLATRLNPRFIVLRNGTLAGAPAAVAA